MADRPEIKPGDWIRVGNRDCVVANVRDPGDAFGDCEVVFDPSKPTNHDVVWNGDEWKFADRMTMVDMLIGIRVSASTFAF